MGTRLSLVCVVLLTLCGRATAEQGYGPLVANGLDEELAIGADLFFSETFGGNGRTCATCHFATENYTLPANLSGIPADDPLFIADPDHPDYVPELELCGVDCDAILDNGLILVNADGANNGPDGFPSYSMRSVPHTLSLPATLDPGPGGVGDATGWSGDGSPDLTLHGFAAGAFKQHFTLDTERLPGDFPVPTDDEADAMLAFQRGLGRSQGTDIAPITFLDGNAAAGDLVFREGRRCSICHALVGLMPNPRNLNFDTHVEEARIDGCPAPLNAGKCAQDSAILVPGANFDGGHGTDPHPSGDGRFGDGKFNIPPLIEAADTGPFFHDNSELSLEAAIAFYRSSFFEAAQCTPLPPPDITCGLGDTVPGVAEREIGAFLRILNAGLNLSMAAQRIHWAFELLATEPGTDPSVIRTLELVLEEVVDARVVIGDVQFEVADGGDGLDVFDDTGGHLTEARGELDAIVQSLLGQIDNGTSGLSLVVTLANMIAVSEDHLAGGFYDESLTSCNGVSLSPGQYHNCRWLYDLGEANVIFDNRGVMPEIVAGATEATWMPNPGGTATVTVKWHTAEWSNPLFDQAVLTDISRSPAFTPITLAGSATVTPLANGQFERSYSYAIDCVPSAKYRLDVASRVGGVTEADVDTVKAARYCIAM